MNPADIRPGVMIENIHNATPPGTHYIIESVGGVADDSIVVVGMYGPNGMAPLHRRFALIRDHFRPTHE